MMNSELDTLEIDVLAAKLAERLAVVPRWMKLKQAVAYSNIRRDRLVTLAKRGQINGFQDMDLKSKPWIFDRESIDQYRSGQSTSDSHQEAEEFALDFMAKLRV